MSNCSVAKKKKTVKRSHLNQNAINEIFDNFELSFKKLLLAFFRALVGAVYNYFLSFCRQDQTLASITISFERQKITLKLKILIIRSKDVSVSRSMANPVDSIFI